MKCEEFLKKHLLEEGNLVEVKEGGTVYTGTIVPTPNQETLVLKLKTGYNAGIKVSEKLQVKKLAEGKKTCKVSPMELKYSKELPSISILHTGGTIASRIDYSTGAVIAGFNPEDLLTIFPELNGLANFNARLISNLMSEDMRFSDYKKIAQAVKGEVEKGVKGIIIGHGTDTLHYTAAALSCILEGINIPVLVVGAQRSSDRGSSDAAMNLVCATEFIKQADFAGVAICMHGSQNDDYCFILPGTKTRKLHTSRRDAFKAVNDLPIAKINYADKKIEYLKKDYSKKNPANKLVLKDKMDERVALLKTHTNMHPEQFLLFKENKFNGLVLEGTGLGHAPINSPENKANKEALKAVIDSGCVVVVTSQCIFGRTHSKIYTNLRHLENLGVIFGEDMLAETAFVKLAWLLGNYSKEEAKKLIAENLRGEITAVTRIDSCQKPGVFEHTHEFH